MKISYNWLKRYLPELEASPEALSEDLPMLGLEVESLEHQGIQAFDHVVVGQVMERKAHPDADRLSVCLVRISEDENIPLLTIVCGAQNYKALDKVPVALVGAVLPGDFKIKKSKIRGVASEGMLCSAKELGLNQESEGLLILDAKTQLGASIQQVFPDTDTVLDISIPANRGDALSHIGIARDLAAYYNIAIKLPEESPLELQKNPSSTALSVHLAPFCSLYNAWIIEGIKVQESPQWLKKDLEAIGLKPINNVVDLTNWIMFETGQPLHAFDAKKIIGNTLHLELSTGGESIQTLDGKNHILPEGLGIIKDAKQIVAIAGVMGTASSQVDEHTTSIILESAYFNPVLVRKASKLLGITSESAYRFARDVDPGMVLPAGKRAAYLIAKVAGEGLVQLEVSLGTPPRLPMDIPISHAYVTAKCGFAVEADTIVSAWKRLGFTVITQENTWLVTVPTHFSDITRPIDLVEEFIRIHGVHHIPEERVHLHAVEGKDSPISQFFEKASSYLWAKHFTECYNYTTVSAKSILEYNPQEPIQYLALENPLTLDQTHLRSSLVPGLLESLQYNLCQKLSPFGIFEHGHTFKATDGSVTECLTIGLLIHTQSGEKCWKSPPKADFYTIKNILNSLLKIAHIPTEELKYNPLEANAFQQGHCAYVGNLKEQGFFATLGTLNMDFCEKYDISSPILALELSFLPTFFDNVTRSTSFQAFSNFPSVRKDIALVADNSILAQDILQDLTIVAQKACKEDFYLRKASIFDVFEGQGLPENKKSIAFELHFASDTKTLTDSQINTVFEAIQKDIEAYKNYQIRR